MSHEVQLDDGRRATYAVVGEGPPALLFPALGFGAAYLRGTAALLAGEVRSYLIDPPGSGGSTPPADPWGYSLDAHVAFYEDVRRALGLGEVVVIGHFFGANAALAYSAAYPHAVSACVTLAAGRGDTGEERTTCGRLVERQAAAPWYPQACEVVDGWTSLVLGLDDPVEAQRLFTLILPIFTAHPDRPDVARGLAEMATVLAVDLNAWQARERDLKDTVDLRPLLGRIACPTLVLEGELGCHINEGVTISEGIADAHLEVIPDCAHIPDLEAPDRFQALVGDFLRCRLPVAV